MAHGLVPDRPLPSVHGGPVIVTGAQRGIGLAIAEAFARAGRDVIIADLSTDVDEAALQDRWKVSTRILALPCDITDVDSVETLLDAAADALQAVPDTLINNAAVQVWGDFLDADPADLHAVIGTNLIGTMQMTQRFARRRVAAGGGGCVINMGSGCNAIAFPKLAGYVASKGGIEMFTKSAAMELGEHGIRVNCIAPGAIETDRTRQETDGYADSWSPLTPLGRIGMVADVADATVALCSESMRFVSGQTVGVDGGLFARAVWPAQY